MNIWEAHKSNIFDGDANVMALIAYAASIVIIFIPGISFISWLVPLIFYFVENKSNFVKFHAMQALLLNIAGIVVKFILGLLAGGNIIAVIFGRHSVFNWGTLAVTFIFSGIISLIIIIFEIIAMIKAYNYEEYKIPLIGNWAHKIVFKNSL